MVKIFKSRDEIPKGFTGSFIFITVLGNAQFLVHIKDYNHITYYFHKHDSFYEDAAGMVAFY